LWKYFEKEFGHSNGWMDGSHSSCISLC
jgi:hypothetical protein